MIGNSDPWESSDTRSYFRNPESISSLIAVQELFLFLYLFLYLYLTIQRIMARRTLPRLILPRVKLS